MEVSIQRITQLSSTGELETCLDQDGHSGQELLQSRDRMQVQAALEFFYESSEEIGSQNSRSCVLEEDSYVLCNQRVCFYVPLLIVTIIILVSKSKRPLL